MAITNTQLKAQVSKLTATNNDLVKQLNHTIDRDDTLFDEISKLKEQLAEQATREQLHQEVIVNCHQIIQNLKTSNSIDAADRELLQLLFDSGIYSPDNFKELLKQALFAQAIETLVKSR